MDKVFEALSSPARRKILAYLAEADLTAGVIAERFDMTKPAISRHLAVLENAGLVVGIRQGQFIRYSIVRESLVNTLNGFVQEVCPVSRPLKKESRVIGTGQEMENEDGLADRLGQGDTAG